LVAEAGKHIDPEVYAWAMAGSGEEVTLIRNRAALRELALVPRMLRASEGTDTSTTLLGVPLSIPVVMAPVGALSLYHPGDAVASAEGAARSGTSAFCATQVVNVTWEDVAATAPGRHFFQMYVLGNGDWMASVADRVESAGFAGLAVTADSPAIGRRDRSLAAGYNWTSERDGPPRNLIDPCVDHAARRRFGWGDLEWLADRTGIPVILKGVSAVTDARRAVDCGCKAIYVSNHGGRTVDHAVSTIEVLEGIVAEVGSDAEVIVDSGFTRGVEVVKALALGARAVGFGKMQCLALALGGADGVAHLLELLRIEIHGTMTNLGCGAVEEVTRDLVRWSSVPTDGTNPYYGQ
jgi:isopentenyl diphosphate isomerase/L-lactate dehydrogenase-like FMN-dependent dehydrogenase